MNPSLITGVRSIGLTREEQVQVDQLKSVIRSQVEQIELSCRVKGSLAIILDWNHLKPTVWREISALLSVLESSPEHKNLLEVLGPLFFALVTKVDLTAIHTDNAFDKIGTFQSRYSGPLKENERYGL